MAWKVPRYPSKVPLPVRGLRKIGTPCHNRFRRPSPLASPGQNRSVQRFGDCGKVDLSSEIPNLPSTSWKCSVNSVFRRFNRLQRFVAYPRKWQKFERLWLFLQTFAANPWRFFGLLSVQSPDCPFPVQVDSVNCIVCTQNIVNFAVHCIFSGFRSSLLCWVLLLKPNGFPHCSGPSCSGRWEKTSLRVGGTYAQHASRWTTCWSPLILDSAGLIQAQTILVALEVRGCRLSSQKAGPLSRTRYNYQGIGTSASEHSWPSPSPRKKCTIFSGVSRRKISSHRLKVSEPPRPFEFCPRWSHPVIASGMGEKRLWFWTSNLWWAES